MKSNKSDLMVKNLPPHDNIKKIQRQKLKSQNQKNKLIP